METIPLDAGWKSRTRLQQITQRIHAQLPLIKESFWFSLSLVLFLLMGPFASIVVLIALWQLAKEAQQEGMAEPAQR